MDTLDFDSDITDIAMDDIAIPGMGRAEPEAPPASGHDGVDRRGSRGGPSERREGAQLIAFRGVTGGVGVTSLAVETAHVLAKSGRTDICLVDLDFGLGMCAHYLDANCVPSVADLSTDPHRLDRQFVQAKLFHHDAGFAVFGSPCELGGNAAVRPDTVLAALDTLADMFGVLILDVPRLSRPWTEAALLASDRVCLVTELTIPALHMTRQRLADFEAMGVARTDVVLAKVERRSFKASLRKGDAVKALGRDVTGVLSFDNHTTNEAMNCGLPSGLVSRGSAYVKDVGLLARELSPVFADRRRKPR